MPGGAHQGILVFLNIDDDLGFAQLFGEARIVLLQFLISSWMGSRLDLGPRFCGVRAWRTPAARSRRQVANNDEYSPSRRSSAPIPPEPLAWSDSVRMRCLYSAVKRRRLAWATTSGSGWILGSAPALPSVALRSPSLRSGSLRPTDGKAAGEGTGTVWLFIEEILSRPAL